MGDRPQSDRFIRYARRNHDPGRIPFPWPVDPIKPVLARLAGGELQVFFAKTGDARGNHGLDQA